MATTNNYGLPLLSSGQAQKEVTVNSSTVILDALTNAAVASRTTTTPPTGVEGMLYIVAAASTGAWAGRDGNVAHFINGAWAFYAPKEGWLFTVTDESSTIVRHLNNVWTELAVGGNSRNQRTAISTAVTITPTDGTVFCNPTAPADITLPQVAESGRFTIMNVSASPITVSAPAVPLDAATVLLIHADGVGAAFTDSSPSAHVLTAQGNATQSVVQSVFGGSSAAFDGSGDYISTPASTDFNMLAGDFTVDCWFYVNDDNPRTLFAFQTDFKLGVFVTGGLVRYFASSTGTSWDILSGDTGTLNGRGTIPISPGTWYHMAFVRSGSNWAGYVNGSTDISVTSTASVVDTSTEGFNIGLWGQGAYGMNGYIDEFRVLKGTAAWLEPFPVPSVAYGYTPTINGAATHPLPLQHDKATYQSDGSNYFVVG